MPIGRFTQRVTIGNAHQTQPFTLEWWALPPKIHSLGTDNPLLQCPPYPILMVSKADGIIPKATIDESESLEIDHKLAILSRIC
ncbi:MAG: hypothetical protein AB4426_18350 [Xenococcaceae cyanobacterium]